MESLNCIARQSCINSHSGFYEIKIEDEAKTSKQSFTKLEIETNNPHFKSSTFSKYRRKIIRTFNCTKPLLSPTEAAPAKSTPDAVFDPTNTLIQVPEENISRYIDTPHFPST